MHVDQHESGLAGGWRTKNRDSGGRLEAPEVLEDLASILRRRPPARLPAGPRTLLRQLREDDDLARRVWSHPMFVDLVRWVKRHYPQYPDAWEEMAIYALSRADACRTGRCSAVQVRAGMADTGWWVDWRGRHSERNDGLLRTVDPEVLIDEPPSATIPVEERGSGQMGPVAYLASVLGGDLPEKARELIERASDVAQEHYVMLALVTGLHGEALLAQGQALNTVNRARRLTGQLPSDWPSTVRKAVVHLLAGTPKDPGLLLAWATVEPNEVPSEVRRRWRGLVAVVDPHVGRLPEPDRRRHRDQARRWTPSTPAQDAIAV